MRRFEAVRVLQGALDLERLPARTYVIDRLLFGRSSGLVAALLVALNLGTMAATIGY
jgi:hypothetical protein